MSDEPKKQRWAWIGWALLALLMLYPLSMGPAIRYFGGPDSRILWNAYYPVVRLCDRSAPLKYLKDRYNDLWGVAYETDSKKGTRTIKIKWSGRE